MRATTTASGIPPRRKLRRRRTPRADNMAASPRGAALVIGGSGGLGREICRRLAGCWPGIFLTYRSRHEPAFALCQELSAHCKAECAPLDLHSEPLIRAVVEEAVAHFGSIGTIVF